MSQVIALFPLWALLASVLAWFEPESFASLKSAIVPLLGAVMFGMGVSLTPNAFLAVARRPALIALGMGLQFGIMPLAGWLIGLGLGLPAPAVAGMVLLGSCPGGTASNVICYLARGDLALSISLTTVSTVLAVLLTPALTWLYVGERVPVPAGAMLVSIAQVVLIPVALGVLMNRLLGPRLVPVQHIFPLISVAAIVLIIAIVVGLNQSNLSNLGVTVALGVVLHNAMGLASGYWIARWSGQDEQRAGTLGIEVGMQNSGLAVALAVKHFSAAAALPGVLFSIWHNLSGSLLAAWWSRR